MDIRREKKKIKTKNNMENEIKERGYTWGTIERKENKEEWRKLVFALCAIRHSKD